MMDSNEPQYRQSPSQTQQPLGPSVISSSSATGNPYEFFLNTPVTPKPTSSALRGNPMKLFLVVAVLAIILVVIGVVVTTLFNNSAPIKGIESVIQDQQELVRVAQLGEHDTNTDTILNLTYNVDLGVSTNQKQLTSYLKSRGITMTTAQLALKQNKSTDTLLTNAQATSTLDTTLRSVLISQLQSYITDIKSAFNATSNTTEKHDLQASYQAGELLLTQANNASLNTQ